MGVEDLKKKKQTHTHTQDDYSFYTCHGQESIVLFFYGESVFRHYYDFSRLMRANVTEQIKKYHANCTLFCFTLTKVLLQFLCMFEKKKHLDTKNTGTKWS